MWSLFFWPCNTIFYILTVFNLFLLQGNKGNPGPVGPPGMKGDGFPGPQVKQTIHYHLMTFIINIYHKKDFKITFFPS